MTGQLVQRLSNVGVLQTSLEFSEMGSGMVISNTCVYASTFDEVSLAPTILSTNLHAWFDAGNRASYPGTGVIWYDISGNGFSGIFTLISPPGSPEPQGLFFNGFSSKIDINVTNPTLPMTLSFWVKPNNAFQMWGIYDSAPGQPHVLRQTHAGDPNNTAEWWDGDPYVSTGMVPGTWQYLTVVYHADTGFRSVETYVNGVPIDSGTGSPYIYYAWTNMVLGCINNSTNWYSGSMGQAQFYSRRMTQEEIAWNYSVDAVRYGLTPSVDIYRNLPPGPTMPQPVAQRQVDDGTLQVKGEFDEVTLSTPTVSGLLVWLDANDSRSYSGSGSTWYDISGNHYDFTLYNSPAFTSGTASYLSFVRNSLQYGDRPGIGDLNSWTIEIWLKISEPLSLVEATAAITTVYDVPGGAHPGVINYCLGTFNGGPSNALTNGFYTGGLWINTSGFTPTIGDWYQVVGTYDGNDLVEYVNGAVLSAASYNWTAVSNGGGIRIARRWDGPLSAIHMFPGSISIARIYDRALNAAEVAHNFAVDHSRFGI